MQSLDRPTRTYRPNWMLLVIALPFGVLLNSLTDGMGRLPDAFLLMTGWIHEPTLFQRWVMKIACHLVLPSAVAWLVLMSTPLGSWLAPNRLALAGLITADVLLCGYAAWRLYMAGTGGIPFLSGMPGEILGAVITASMVIGLLSLVASTVWHRFVRDKRRVLARIGVLLREV